MKCPECKNEVSPEWKRCPYCEYKPKLCSKEGCKSGWLPAEAHFCPLCGSPVKGEESLRIKEIIDRAVAAVVPSRSTESTTPSGECSDLTFTVNGISFTMIRVEGGSFMMGAADNDNEAYDDEKPQHRVTLSSYYIGETQVTQALWEAVMGNNPSRFKGDNLPVGRVSWHDCWEFIEKLNQKTGRRFRLPTETEWEFAARGGNKSKGFKYAGSNNLEEVAWYDKNAYYCGSSSANASHPDYGTHPVGQKKPNELGLYDMIGNVWEWCQDWFGSYNNGSQNDPTGPTSGAYRVYRGGSWYYGARYCRLSYRDDCTPDIACCDLGFRLVLSE